MRWSSLVWEVTTLANILLYSEKWTVTVKETDIIKGKPLSRAEMIWKVPWGQNLTYQRFQVGKTLCFVNTGNSALRDD